LSNRAYVWLDFNWSAGEQIETNLAEAGATW
jgi:hypothetical protein